VAILYSRELYEIIEMRFNFDNGVGTSSRKGLLLPARVMNWR
jgi:hypothetical protein